MKKALNTSKYKSIELLLLFFVLPVFLAAPLSIYLKLLVTGGAVIYVATLLIQAKQWKTPQLSTKTTQLFWFRTLSLGVLILGIGAAILWKYNPSLLFNVVKTKPVLWVKILFIYSFLSVLPQELIYRKFFYLRYESLITNRKLLYFLNVLCFSLCHLFLKNFWVILITIIGGILFTYTYEKTKSVLWTSIEHAIYGNLVFTIGLGTMLAFPG